MARQATAHRYTKSNQKGGKSKSKDKEMKFATQDQMSKGNYGTYNSVKEIIIQEVQKKYRHGSDIAKSIRDGKLLDLSTEEPTRKLSEEKSEEAKKIDQDGLNIHYQEELRVFFDRKSLLRENQSKTFSLILSSYCTLQMQQRIEDHPDYATDIVDNPIRLINEIKTLTHDTLRAEYPIASIVDHLARWLNTVQYPNESLNDYAKRSKYNGDIVKNLICL